MHVHDGLIITLSPVSYQNFFHLRSGLVLFSFTEYALNFDNRKADVQQNIPPWGAGILPASGASSSRKHGDTKCRVWRKIHIRIDEQTPEIRGAEFTTGDVGDVEPVNATASSEPARDAA